MSLATTEALGIHQSDIIIRSAIIAAIADMRSNPWLLDYVFAGLARDNLTKAEYGSQEVAKAKLWFQNTNIPVVYSITTNEVKYPCISIALLNSSEQEQEGTVSDTHYVPVEDNDDYWPKLLGPLTPTSYDVVTGKMGLAADDVKTFILAAGMLVLAKDGKTYPILEVVDEVTIKLDKNLAVDFGDIQIRGARPAYNTTLESAVYKESYAIGCHVEGEPVFLHYLHSILVFALLRYKEALLEARGYERSILNSTDFRREDDLQPEFMYSRYISITGAVRQYWPKLVVPKITSMITDPVPQLGSQEPSPIQDRDSIEDMADQDPLTIAFKL